MENSYHFAGGCKQERLTREKSYSLIVTIMFIRDMQHYSIRGNYSCYKVPICPIIEFDLYLITISRLSKFG